MSEESGRTGGALNVMKLLTLRTTQPPRSLAHARDDIRPYDWISLEGMAKVQAAAARLVPRLYTT